MLTICHIFVCSISCFAVLAFVVSIMPAKHDRKGFKDCNYNVLTNDINYNFLKNIYY